MRHTYEWITREGVANTDCVRCCRELTNGYVELRDRFEVMRRRTIAFYYYCVRCGGDEQRRKTETI